MDLHCDHCVVRPRSSCWQLILAYTYISVVRTSHLGSRSANGYSIFSVDAMELDSDTYGPLKMNMDQEIQWFRGLTQFTSLMIGLTWANRPKNSVQAQ